MTDRIAHRGPDATGAVEPRGRPDLGPPRPPPAVDHRPVRGGRPAVRQGRPDLSYNGELYNYRELRAELTSTGSRFRTSSDTEVVLEAWRHWGPDALPRFRGMFAFALLDERTGELVLARDPLGHQAAVLPAPRRRRGLRLRAEGDRARGRAPSCGSSPAPWSPRCSTTGCPSSAAPSTGVQKLPAGSWARFRPDGTQQRAALLATPPTWPPRPRQARPPTSREVIEESVDRAPGRRRAGVELPVRRPGLQHHHGRSPTRPTRQVDAYTITFRPEDQRLEAMPDDAVYARKVAAAVRHRAARDRDLPRHRRPAAADGRHPRRADRRPGRDQHAADVRGGPRRAASRSSCRGWARTSCSAATASTSPA